MTRVIGSIYPIDSEVDRLHAIRYLIASHLNIPQITQCIIPIFWSHSLLSRLGEDPRICVDSHSLGVSYLPTLFLHSSSQNSIFCRIPVGIPSQVLPQCWWYALNLLALPFHHTGKEHLTLSSWWNPKLKYEFSPVSHQWWWLPLTAHHLRHCSSSTTL